MEWKDQHQGQHVPQLLPVPAGVWCEGSEAKAHPFVLGMESSGGARGLRFIVGRALWHALACQGQRETGRRSSAAAGWVGGEGG